MEQHTLGEFHYKANIFKVLSELYKKPEQDHEDLFPPFLEAIEAIFPELHKEGEKVKKIFGKEDLKKNQSILIDYSKLFVGPFDVLAPPYGSVYLEEARQIQGQSTRQVERLYEKAGIEKTADFHEPADHIAVELEFIYYLYYMYIDTNELNYLVLIKEFINNHLGRWIFQFTDRLEEHATHNYYKKLSILTREIFKLEMENLKVESMQ
ncbi:TorD/DmsD family molecular chaperone [Salipaludibacillus daqingensis]|uniref:TorD/DmsD family molecular chaperone n=1 Tax=Salipaludibacillus daqingensis TaxID=3041001 RepID=UPI0024731C5E|nr:molecular chaperone TorD family protein [Salipaludibacillus daqingensis]